MGGQAMQGVNKSVEVNESHVFFKKPPHPHNEAGPHRLACNTPHYTTPLYTTLHNTATHAWNGKLPSWTTSTKAASIFSSQIGLTPGPCSDPWVAVLGPVISAVSHAAEKKREAPGPRFQMEMSAKEAKGILIHWPAETFSSLLCELSVLWLRERLLKYRTLSTVPAYPLLCINEIHIQSAVMYAPIWSPFTFGPYMKIRFWMKQNIAVWNGYPRLKKEKIAWWGVESFVYW